VSNKGLPGTDVQAAGDRRIRGKIFGPEIVPH
jgi:hypothetical protein